MFPLYLLVCGILCDRRVVSSLSYASAVEHNGKLYIGYSDNGGRTGMNVNSAELAVIPLAALDD